MVVPIALSLIIGFCAAEVWREYGDMMRDYREAMEAYERVLNTKKDVGDSVSAGPQDAPEAEAAEQDFAAGAPEDIKSAIKRVFPESPGVALAVARAESGLDPKAPSVTDRLADGRAYSIGLFQINLTVSRIGGVDCQKAFLGKNGKARVVDEGLFKKCVELAENPQSNLLAAREKWEVMEWKAWGAFNNGAYLQYL